MLKQKCKFISALLTTSLLHLLRYMLNMCKQSDRWGYGHDKVRRSFKGPPSQSSIDQSAFTQPRQL